MITVGWLADEGGTLGGAELTTAEFKTAAPDEVRIYNLQPGPNPWPECDRYVVQNCVLYTAEDLTKIVPGRPLIKYWHDVGPHLQPGVKEALADAQHVCCSPIQAEYMQLDATCIPPPVDLSRFEQAGAQVNGDRKGAVSVASWRNSGKGPHRVSEWASQNGGIDVYGGGMFAPPGAQEVAYDRMPELLAKYETFVFLPVVLEPFGRLVAEAWAAGCEVITNGLVGAKHWIENDPDAIDTAAEDFWKLVLS